MAVDIFGATIDDGLIAVLVAAALTALFGVLGWTLKQAFNVANAVKTLESQIDDHERRISNLERP